MHGRRGVDFMTDLLIHWTERVASAVSAASRGAQEHLQHPHRQTGKGAAERRLADFAAATSRLRGRATDRVHERCMLQL
jgi:hypothetical protein